jgi:hypothetical protein
MCNMHVSNTSVSTLNSNSRKTAIMLVRNCSCSLLTVADRCGTVLTDSAFFDDACVCTVIHVHCKELYDAAQV